MAAVKGREIRQQNIHEMNAVNDCVSECLAFQKLDINLVKHASKKQDQALPAHVQNAARPPSITPQHPKISVHRVCVLTRMFWGDFHIN